MRRKRSSRDVDTMRRVAENSKATVSRKKRRTIKQQVSWSTAEPSIRVQLDSSLLFPDYDEGDVWYTVSPGFDDPFNVLHILPNCVIDKYFCFCQYHRDKTIMNS